MMLRVLLLAFPFVSLTQQTEPFESSLPMALHNWKLVVGATRDRACYGRGTGVLAEGILWIQNS